MKYNAITILVDSAVWECVGNTRTTVSATPFLDSLKKESITTTNLYSHDPFTDAATRSLYSGRNTLDDYSFFFKLNSSPSNHFKSFHDNGYETYGIYYPYYMYGKDIQKYIDHSFYSSHFIFMSEWHTFMWFADIIKKRELEDREMKLLYKRMELMLDVWIRFYEDVKAHPEKGEMIAEKLKDFDIDQGLTKLYDILDEFQKDKEAFIVQFLKDAGDPFWEIDKIDFDSLIDNEFIDKEVFGKYHRFFTKAAKNNFKANVLKERPSLKRLLYGMIRLLKTRNIDEVKFIANYLTSLNSFKIMKKQSHVYEWKTETSSYQQMSLAAKILKERKSEKPFYLSMHVLEPHNYLTCFTFDKQDTALIAEEIKVLDEYVDAVGTNFKGNLLYFLSLRYVDYCIEKFCAQLKEMGIWDTTALLIVADHGSSYTFHPIHNARVNCFDDECYHIPMLMRVPGIEQTEVTHYCNSKDILPTYMDALGLEKDKAFKGHSLLDKAHHWPDYVQTEYTGPGCPEVRGRRLWFSARNKEYMVAYKVAVYENFEDGELVEVHDLKQDPNCYYNIAKKVDKGKIASLLDVIHRRFEEVKKDSKEFIEKL